MPVAQIRGVNLFYRVIGNTGPWMALITGGRRSHEEFIPLSEKIAERGFRVLLHDRRNTGASDILIEGDEPEESLWIDDLHALMASLDALPAYIAGSSAGARMAMRFYLRYRPDVKALLLMRVTGGEFAANRLPEMYYEQFIRIARDGGMEAICANEQYRERFIANPGNRDRLLAMDPEHYISVMACWRDKFVAGAHLPVMGITDEELASMDVPTIVIPGNDKTHSLSSGRLVHKLVPGSRLHELPIDETDEPLVPIEDWAPLEREIADVVCDFMRGSVSSSRHMPA